MNPLESLIQKYQPKTPRDFENACKEVIQEMTLAGLARSGFFSQAAFYGGTALRIFYGLPRFSEDLDFTLFRTQPDFTLKPYFASIKEVLFSFGIDVSIEEVSKKEKKVDSAFLKANTKIHLLKIHSIQALAKKIPSNQVMKIKFEVDIFPPQGFETEVKTLFPPITAAIKVLKPSSLFAGKMHAVLFREWGQRVKGRDFYDLLWYLGQKIPLKLSYLEQKMKEGGTLQAGDSLSSEKVSFLLLKKIESLHWKSAKADIAPFLRDAKEIEPWGSDFFKDAVKSLQFES